MAERECVTNFRFFPELVTAEIARFFQGELREGLTTQWGIRWGNGVCLHWFVTVNVGEKDYTPSMCFETKQDAIDYCNIIGGMFPEVCKMFFGQTTHQYSSN